MPTTKRTFHKGRMNLDDDSRLLENGEYREAYNIDVINSEGSDVGAVEKTLSNKQLTNLDVGANPYDIGKYEDEQEDKLYWFTKSDTGCFLFEWDNINQSASIVLKDTRNPDIAPEDGGRVLNLKETHLITGIQKVVSEDTSEDLLLWTDDNIQPCCINIERAKTWGENNFEEDDIFLIKKPPRYAPTVTPTYTNDKSNNLEERFPLFAYRYKYRDGEYSAISDYTNYQFYPNKFNLDFFTLDNLGMLSNFNAAKIVFDTGKSQVTDIQIIFKESNSNTLYVIESFNKSENGWGDNQSKTHIFSNNKKYIPLPEKELYRSFDSVPRLAKALTVLENYPVLGNYLEGYNIVDENGNAIRINYTVNLINTSIDDAASFNIDNTVSNKLLVTNPNTYLLQEGYGLSLYFNLEIGGNTVYENTFGLILDNTYATLDDLFSSNQFDILLTVINNDFQANFNSEGLYTVPDGWNVDTLPSVTYANEGGGATFTVSQITFLDSNNGDNPESVDVDFSNESNINIGESTNSVSCKTNRDYEVGLVYMDNYNRRTTTLTSPSNTLYIPQEYSIFKNNLQIQLNNKPPYWADRYKIVVKTPALEYQTLYVNEFYAEDFYSWCKLEAENKDKIKVGDMLIIKRAGDVIINNPVEVKVLEIESKEKDFIELNQDEDGNDIIEREGVYMKIRPVGFSMDRNDFKVETSTASGVTGGGFPVTYLDLFTDDSNPSPVDLSIGFGSSISIRLHSNRLYSSGWVDITFEETFYAQRNYNSIEGWFNEVILSRNSLLAYSSSSGEYDSDYLPNISLVRGIVSSGIFSADPNGKLYLKSIGLLSAGTGNRSWINAEIVVRNSAGVYVFETKPNKIDNGVFYETEQAFDIVDGYHLANNQSQSAIESTAVIDLDFFNCYTQGNGVESYKVRDGFNTNYLNIDSRPSSTSVEPYREIRRFADLTFGQPFVESTGLNGLNEFNASTLNFKELDKQYGSIQALSSRERDLVVWQEEKTGYVLFGRNLIQTAKGDATITKTTDILGEHVLYQGDNGIGTNPESLAWDSYRFYWSNSRYGTPVRLSRDGTSSINYKTINFFRELYIENPTSKKVGGFNPYNNTYLLTTETEDPSVFNVFCGNQIFKTISEPFIYVLNLNKLIGDIVIQYNIQGGSADISIEHNGTTDVFSSATGTGSESVARNDINIDTAIITITPLNSATIDISLTNLCPIGIPMNLYTIVLSEETNLGETTTNRFRWGGNTLYSENHIFEDFEISQFLLETGLEGNGKFPSRGSNVNIQSFKDTTDTFKFDANTLSNKLGYLVTDSNYGEGDINTILDEATFVATTETQLSLDSFINQGNFIFNRPSDSHNLYLIWDYTIGNQAPIAVDDFASVEKGSFKDIDVLLNDSDPDNDTITPEIVTQPTYGTVSINVDNTIRYTHDDSSNFEDSFTYRVFDGISYSNVATVGLAVGVSAGDSITANGVSGVYLVPFVVGTGEGDLVVHFDAIGVPDRLEILFDVNNNPSSINDVASMPVVADSLFIGDNIVANQAIPANGVTSNLDLNLYNGTSFDVIESGTQTLTITDSVVASNVGNRTDIAPNTTSRNGSGGTQVGVQNLVYTSPSDVTGLTGLNYADGNIALRYSKPESTAFIAYLRVTGFTGTAWNIHKTEFITP